MQRAPVEQWRSIDEARRRRPLLARPRNLDALWHRAAGAARRIESAGRYLAAAQRLDDDDKRVRELSESAIGEAVGEMLALFRAGRDTPRDLLRAAAIIRELSRRRLGMRHYPVQIAGALALSRGRIIEMATGEGKTLVATIPAVIAGWRGRGCHVITVNDYLARRDALWMAPLYRACGLTVSWITAESTPAERRAAYLADVTYLTNKEAAADFLRDRLVLGRDRALASALIGSIAGDEREGSRLGRLVQRGLACAVIDEADSVLIDEAVTPLIISTEAGNDEQTRAYQQAALVAADMREGEHYMLDRREHEVRLTRAGLAMLEKAAADLGGVWSGMRRAEELITQAIIARELYHQGRQYVVQDGRIVIVDEFTGRVMPDRTWRAGLHQAVEAKEGLPLTSSKDTLARISFQRFFRLYGSLCGMSGTAREEAAEFWQVYRLPVVTIPTNTPCIRRELPDRVFTTAQAKRTAAVAECARLHAQGRPVLLGVRSVLESELISSMLNAAGLEHAVLNALRHAEEAHIIARAGEAGRITVATNMAGRGTDIRLGPAVAGKGGLHVLATERHESRRIDRQLFGRCARQGDPGSTQTFFSLEDELLSRHAPRAARALIAGTSRPDGELSEAAARAASAVAARAQARAQALARRRRAAVLRADDWLDEALGFAGDEL